MTIETLIRDRLVADATVLSLVSSRIYPLILPQGPTYPAVTFSRVSGVRLSHLTGASGHASPRITFNAWATTFLGARAVADAVRGSLDGFIGKLDTTPVAIRLENELDLEETEPVVNGVPLTVYRVMQDYRVQHRET